MNHILKITTTISFLLINTAYAANFDPENIGSMMISDTNNNMAMGLLKMNKLGQRERLVFGNQNDYKKLGLQYPAQALEHASVFIVRAQDGSALLRINNIRRINSPFHIVLRDPGHGYLYSWKIQPFSQGQFQASLNQTMQYKDFKLQPKIRKTPASVKKVVFPITPQPQLQTKNKPSKTTEIKQIVTNIQGVQIAPVSFSITSPKLTAFAKLASQMLPDIIISEAKKGIHIQQIASTVALLNQTQNTQQYQPALQTVAYNPNRKISNSNPIFGWTNTLVYRVKKEDMALDEIIRNVTIDEHISIDAAMAATYINNKKSFGSASLYILKKGSILHMPPRYLINEIASSPIRLENILRQATSTERVL